MPEGDTVFIAARRLRSALATRVVTRFDLRVPRLALVDLTGDTVEAIAPVGKHLLMRFSSGLTLHSHLRMDGAWRVSAASGGAAGRSNGGSTGAPEHAIRALIGNSDYLATGVRVHDLIVVPTAQEHTVIGHLGPDLLDPAADIKEAVRRLRLGGDRPAGEALLDQRIAAGIGNVYKSELLFLHRLSPWLPVERIPDPHGLFLDAARLLRANLGDFNRSTTGWQQRGQQYWVYGRGGKACRRCRQRICKHERLDVLGDRLTYYCPNCQRRD